MILRLATIATLAFMLPSLALASTPPAKWTPQPGVSTLYDSVGNPITSANPLPVNATVSASITGFQPTAGAVANLAVTTTTNDVALPAGATVVVTNAGTADAAFRVQTGAGTALNTDQVLKSGASASITVGANTHLSAITAITSSGSTTLNIQGGTGLATGYGGGGSSNASVGTNGTTAPTSSTQIGVLVSGNLQPASASNPVPVTANAGTNLNTSALATSTNITGGGQKTQIVDGSANVIGSNLNALNVNPSTASYALLTNASSSGSATAAVPGGNYGFPVSGTFGGSTLTITATVNNQTKTVFTGTSAPSTETCAAIDNGAVLQATLTGGSPSAMYVGANQLGTCPSNSAATSPFSTASAVINVSTAVTTQLVALSSGKLIYVNSYDLISAGTTNVTFEYGTGTACATGTTALTGAYPLTAQVGLAPNGGNGPIFVVPASNALCVVNSAAVQISGRVSYAQQ